jgi:hypothetical protein
MLICQALLQLLALSAGNERAANVPDSVGREAFFGLKLSILSLALGFLHCLVTVENSF